MSRLAAWCERSGQFATSDEIARMIDFDGKPRWRCPKCDRALKLAYQTDRAGDLNADSRGWFCNYKPRWPRHYEWSQDLTIKRRPSAEVQS